MMNIEHMAIAGDSVSFVVRGVARVGVVDNIRKAATGNWVLTIKVDGQFKAFKAQDISEFVNWTARSEER